MSAPDPPASPAEPTPSRRILSPNLVASEIDGGRIAENILNFSRLLRTAGLPVGPAQVVTATRAVLAAGIEKPSTLYWALHASLVSRPEHHMIFDQAFLVFWKDPSFLNQMLSVMLPRSPKAGERPKADQMARRLSEPLLPKKGGDRPEREGMLELDMADSFSAAEVLRTKDFEDMTADEQRRAREAIRRMSLFSEELETRRFKSSRRGRTIDLRRTLAAMAAKGPDVIELKLKQRRRRRPPLVILCDISGSMDTYARMLLHVVHALTNARDRVSVFLFGTRLTNVTRALKGRDPDAAVAKVSKDVVDWSGGTRIGEALTVFNRRWARRVLGQNATVLLVTDGLDREGGEGISVAARRLKASCRRLIWLNPLLRYDAYEPLAAGARELAGQVSELRACHNLASLESLIMALGAKPSADRAIRLPR